MELTLGTSENGKAFLGRLVGRGLVESSRGQYRVRDFLFGNKG